MFSPSSEIQSYLQMCVDKHNLSQYIKLSHRVVGARWDQTKHKWYITVQNEETRDSFEDSCDFLINAGGILNNWKWPDIPGLSNFKGKLVHSANWPSDWNYDGLRVAVLGNGSSGIQIVPTMQPKVRELIHPIRSSTWVTPSAPARYAILLGRPMPDVFSDEQKESFRNDPGAYLKFRIEIERETNRRFPLLLQNSDKQQAAIRANTQAMIDRLGPEATDKFSKDLIPSFPVGCRRITPGLGYLESFSKPNVRVITNTKIERVSENGIVLDSGEEIEVDAIVAATGFDVSFSPRFPIVGRDSLSLKDVWSESIPYSYLSTAVPGFPNYFVLLGPNAPIAHGSVLAVTEHCSKFLLQMITKAQTEGIVSMDVKQSACDDYMTHIHHYMPRTTWAAECSSWFKGGHKTGPVTATHPGSRVHWFHAMERPKFEDFDYQYEGGNRFRYLGNGFSSRELGIYEPGTVGGWDDEDVDREACDDTWFVTDNEWRFLYY
jgi:cation diffusion facilitator CzcD-associated flavoprotein CzcO